MSDTVKIFHPVTEATSEVPASSVPAWQRAGWQAVGDAVSPTTEEPQVGDLHTPQRKRRGHQTPAVRSDNEDAGASETTTDKE